MTDAQRIDKLRVSLDELDSELRTPTTLDRDTLLRLRQEVAVELRETTTRWQKSLGVWRRA